MAPRAARIIAPLRSAVNFHPSLFLELHFPALQPVQFKEERGMKIHLMPDRATLLSMQQSIFVVVLDGQQFDVERAPVSRSLFSLFQVNQPQRRRRRLRREQKRQHDNVESSSSSSQKEIKRLAASLVVSAPTFINTSYTTDFAEPKCG